MTPAPPPSDPKRRGVLTFAPVETIDDPLRRECLNAANGRDLVQDRVTAILFVVAPVVLLAFVIACVVRGG